MMKFMKESPRSAIKYSIDTGIQMLQDRVKNIIRVYGGVSKDLEKRYFKHVRENNPLNSRNMEVCVLYSLTVENVDQDQETIKNAENYLINELDRIFGECCENARTPRGVIKQREDTSIGEVGDVYQIYIMYGTIMY